MHDGNLYVAARGDGLYVQSPASIGEWTQYSIHGAVGIALLGEDVIVGKFTFDQEALVRRSPGDTTWHAMGFVDYAGLLDVKEFREGSLVVPTYRRGFMLSGDGGETWQQVRGRDGAPPLCQRR